MTPETKREKELDRQQKTKIILEARDIKYDFKKWGFSVNILPIHPHNGWGKMTYKQIYQPEAYDLYLGEECLAKNMLISDLRKIYLKAKRYRHDYGVKKLRENAKRILK